MILFAPYIAPDGEQRPSYHVAGYCPYDYFYPDVSEFEEFAGILDRILERNCIPRWMADDFAANFVEFVSTLRSPENSPGEDCRER